MQSHSKTRGIRNCEKGILYSCTVTAHASSLTDNVNFKVLSNYSSDIDNNFIFVVIRKIEWWRDWFCWCLLFLCVKVKYQIWQIGLKKQYFTDAHGRNKSVCQVCQILQKAQFKHRYNSYRISQSFLRNFKSTWLRWTLGRTSK